ncbi:hypothetical protein DBV15_05129 [Temnothorax longispinosus]|uniref:Uncharacterized protein n=1 Tax=Temnothorax longispinosus TaxID=300112 RepID=A0A4V3SBN9_9HYME|nr:hypothetical protein DBV15_05129 [Temnothorax longispinosus]
MKAYGSNRKRGARIDIDRDDEKRTLLRKRGFTKRREIDYFPDAHLAGEMQSRLRYIGDANETVFAPTPSTITRRLRLASRDDNDITNNLATDGDVRQSLVDGCCFSRITAPSNLTSRSRAAVHTVRTLSNRNRPIDARTRDATRVIFTSDVRRFAVSCRAGVCRRVAHLGACQAIFTEQGMQN